MRGKAWGGMGEEAFGEWWWWELVSRWSSGGMCTWEGKCGQLVLSEAGVSGGWAELDFLGEPCPPICRVCGQASRPKCVQVSSDVCLGEESCGVVWAVGGGSSGVGREAEL